MTTRHFTIAAAIAVSAAIVFFAASPVPPDSSTIVHKVRKGESVSLVCIRYYGHYTAAMGSAVKKMNPAVKDINLVLPGQKLTLPHPEKPPADASVQAQVKVDTSKTAVLFEKKVNATQGVVTCVEGTAFVTAKGGAAKKKLIVNTLVYPGDVIETGKPGRVEIIINRESVVRMKENTRLIIEAFRDNSRQKGSTQVGFTLGTVWAKIKKFKDAVSRFDLELPTAVAGVHGTVYQAGVAADSSAEVKVYDGEVAVKSRRGSDNGEVEGATEVPGPEELKGPREVTAEQWIEILRAMQRIAIDKDGRPSSVQEFTADTGDTWEQWNEERDEQIEEIFEE
jgi:phage tail protein X